MPEHDFKLGVLVSGRGSNLQAILDAARRNALSARVAVVISNKADAPALDRARAQGVETLFLDPRQYAGREAYDRALAEALRARKVDLVCLAGFMRILSPEFIRAFPGRIINIHPSLLPAFPGLHAQRQALEHGVRITGCTVHFVDETVDTGPILLQAAVPVEEDDDEERLAARILEQEHRIYPEAIQLIADQRVRIEGRRARILEKQP